jgi:hypothetical protein
MKPALYILLLIVLVPAFAYPQKAYTAVKYSGGVLNMAVNFTLADGYLAGCKITTTDNKTHKTVLYLPENGYADEHEILKFYPRSANGKTAINYFIIEGLQEQFEALPVQIHGKYYFNNKAYKFALKR